MQVRDFVAGSKSLVTHLRKFLKLKNPEINNNGNSLIPSRQKRRKPRCAVSSWRQSLSVDRSRPNSETRGRRNSHENLGSRRCKGNQHERIAGRRNVAG